LRICGVRRDLVVLVIGGAGLTLLYYTRALLALAWALFLGNAAFQFSKKRKTRPISVLD
jgi:hypothetical protein